MASLSADREVEPLLLGAVAQASCRRRATRDWPWTWNHFRIGRFSSLLAGGGGAWTNKKTPRVREVCATSVLVALR
jgi:hypothetical protein